MSDDDRTAETDNNPHLIRGVPPAEDAPTPAAETTAPRDVEPGAKAAAGDDALAEIRQMTAQSRPTPTPTPSPTPTHAALVPQNSDPVGPPPDPADRVSFAPPDLLDIPPPGVPAHLAPPAPSNQDQPEWQGHR